MNLTSHPPTATPTDVTFENHGSVFLARLHTQAARDWVREHVRECTYFGNAIGVEPRYVEDLITGMAYDGLQVAS